MRTIWTSERLPLESRGVRHVLRSLEAPRPGNYKVPRKDF